MRGSPFAASFEKEAKDWEAKLLYIQDALDQVLSCQKSWLYLEPIFSSEDIVRQMPSEAKRFLSVDQLWRNTMGFLKENPSVLDFADIENLLPSFQQAVARLEEIQKGLDDYLETKRLFFPRFFFLSNDELLSILSETKDPLRVQPHLNKCFEGIAKVRFDDKVELINTLVSAEGECVILDEPVNVASGENKGAVEKWLKQLERGMQDTLRTVTSNSVKAYAIDKREDWVLKWPGQVVLSTDMIYWTSETTTALQTQRLDVHLEKINDQLKAVVHLVRGELTSLNRKTLAALTTIDVHNRDVVANLLASRVPDADAFDWLAQLRYYFILGAGNSLTSSANVSVVNSAVSSPTVTNKQLFTQTEVEVKIVNSALKYAFEYLGNSDRLVITPLTDRCYRTLMGAYHLYFGGAPEGPAGTGKTESVKGK